MKCQNCKKHEWNTQVGSHMGDVRLCAACASAFINFRERLAVGYYTMLGAIFGK